MADLVRTLEDTHGPIALALFVAGNYWPVQGEKPDPEKFRKTYEVNLFGVLNGLVPVAEHMRGRGRGPLLRGALADEEDLELGRLHADELKDPRRAAEAVELRARHDGGRLRGRAGRARGLDSHVAREEVRDLRGHQPVNSSHR